MSSGYSINSISAKSSSDTASSPLGTEPRPGTFLILQYRGAELGVVYATQREVCAQRLIPSHEAHNLLIPTIHELLTACAVPLASLSAVAVTRGPGHFIVLRALISTAYGINYALGIPLIGLDPIPAPDHDAAAQLVMLHRATVHAWDTGALTPQIEPIYNRSPTFT